MAPGLRRGPRRNPPLYVPVATAFSLNSIRQREKKFFSSGVSRESHLSEFHVSTDMPSAANLIPPGCGRSIAKQLRKKREASITRRRLFAPLGNVKRRIAARDDDATSPTMPSAVATVALCGAYAHFSFTIAMPRFS